MVIKPTITVTNHPGIQMIIITATQNPTLTIMGTIKIINRITETMKMVMATKIIGIPGTEAVEVAGVGTGIIGVEIIGTLIGEEITTLIQNLVIKVGGRFIHMSIIEEAHFLR